MSRMASPHRTFRDAYPTLYAIHVRIQRLPKPWLTSPEGHRHPRLNPECMIFVEPSARLEQFFVNRVVVGDLDGSRICGKRSAQVCKDVSHRRRTEGVIHVIDRALRYVRRCCVAAPYFNLRVWSAKAAGIFLRGIAELRPEFDAHALANVPSCSQTKESAEAATHVEDYVFRERAQNLQNLTHVEIVWNFISAAVVVSRTRIGCWIGRGSRAFHCQRFCRRRCADIKDQLIEQRPRWLNYADNQGSSGHK
jgi:hypothetical protein